MNRRITNPVNAGDIFNNFTVLDERAVKRGITSVRSERQLLCRCVCGKEKWYPKSSIVCGTIKSCGCVSRIKHGQWHTRIYNIWYGMLRRCCVTHDKAYPLYGGRGITVCNEWKNDFFKFKEWAENNGYNDNLTIDRIDVNGNYCPDNCRWVSMKVQQNNRRNNHYIVWQGEKYSVAQLAELHGIKGSLLSARLRKGEPLETALVKEDRRGRTTIRYAPVHEARGESHTVREWAMIIGCDAKKLSQKMSQQLHFEHALDLAEWGVYQKKSGKISFREWFKLKYGKDYGF